MKTIERLMREKDESITLHHQNKDIEELKSSLRELESEHDKIKKDFNSISYFLNLINKHSVNDLDSLTNEVIKHEDFNKWLEETKSVLEKLHLKDTDELSISEKEFIKTEKSKLTYEHKRLQKHLNYLDQIIAKTKLLLQDLQDGYCADLTNGHNITAVGNKLLEKFGKKSTLTTYSEGREKIINFLESTYSINKKQSKQLSDLLEDLDVLKFEVDMTTIKANLSYYSYDEGGYGYEPTMGTWSINS